MPSEKPMNRRTFLLGAGALLLTACGRKSSRTHATSPEGSPVLALGDSLTFGYGANPGESYPAQLQKLTGWSVVNGGVSGDTSAQALSRLPTLLARKPKLVIVGIGDNDFLRKVPEEQTRANIAKIIETVQKENIPAVLVGVPHITLGALFGHLSDHPLYEDLSKEYGIPLFGGAWAEILGDNNLKSDQIHANGKGYRKFAEDLNQFLRKQGFR